MFEISVTLLQVPFIPVFVFIISLMIWASAKRPLDEAITGAIALMFIALLSINIYNTHQINKAEKKAIENITNTSDLKTIETINTGLLSNIKKDFTGTTDSGETITGTITSNKNKWKTKNLFLIEESNTYNILIKNPETGKQLELEKTS